MLEDFLGKGNIGGNFWFGYNCQFYTQKTQNWENLVISGLLNGINSLHTHPTQQYIVFTGPK
jgi:hypothetical protein